MKSFRKDLWFNLSQRRGFVNIAGEVQKAIGESGIREGLCLAKTRHRRDNLCSAPFQPVPTRWWGISSGWA